MSNSKNQLSDGRPDEGLRLQARDRLHRRREFRRKCRRLQSLIEQLRERAPHDPAAQRALAQITKLLAAGMPHVRLLTTNAERRIEELAKGNAAARMKAGKTDRFV